MSNRVVSLTFRHIIDDVIANVRQDFEDMGIEREVLEELQRSWEAKLVATQVTEFEGAHGPASLLHGLTPYTTTPGVSPQVGSSRAPQAPKQEPGAGDEGAPAGAPSAPDAGTDADDSKAGAKRKRSPGDEGASDEIGSDLDDSDEEEAEGNEDMMLCLYDKVRMRSAPSRDLGWTRSCGGRPRQAHAHPAGPACQKQVEVRSARRCGVDRRTRLPLLQVQRVCSRSAWRRLTMAASLSGSGVTCRSGHAALPPPSAERKM